MGQLLQEAAWPHTARAQLILLGGARYGECDAPADAGHVKQEAERRAEIKKLKRGGT